MVLGALLVQEFEGYSRELAWVGLFNWLPFFWAFWGFQPYLATAAARRRVALALVAAFEACGAEAELLPESDAETLELVKDAVGSVRVDIEAMLSVGLPNTPMSITSALLPRTANCWRRCSRTS